MHGLSSAQPSQQALNDVGWHANGIIRAPAQVHMHGLSSARPSQPESNGLTACKRHHMGIILSSATNHALSITCPPQSDRTERCLLACKWPHTGIVLLFTCILIFGATPSVPSPRSDQDANSGTLVPSIRGDFKQFSHVFNRHGGPKGGCRCSVP